MEWIFFCLFPSPPFPLTPFVTSAIYVPLSHTSLFLSNVANGSDFDVLGCARPETSPPLAQPKAVEIAIKGVGCHASFHAVNETCDDAVIGVSYDVVLDVNGWITKVS